MAIKTSQIFGVFGFSFFLVVTALVQAGCTANMTTPATAPEDGPKPLGGLNGTWETGCTQNTIVQGGNGSGTIEISEQSYKVTLSSYSDADCTISVTSGTEEGTFKSLGPSASFAKAYDIEYLIQKSSFSSDAVPHFRYGLMLIENGAMYLSDGRTLTSDSRLSEVDRRYIYKLK
ncbi:MAG: hypothetical protein JNM39_19010 [Bdellovibrionaceae bacterium]|nr:hypothetical protein [Pseudobdellovibrionaceae bacterium]